MRNLFRNLTVYKVCVKKKQSEFVDIPHQLRYNTARNVPASMLGQIHVYPYPQLPRTAALVKMGLPSSGAAVMVK